MTVRDLRRELDTLPEDLEVKVYADVGDGYGPSFHDPHCWITTWAYGDEGPDHKPADCFAITAD